MASTKRRKLLSTREVAELFGCDVRTVNRWVRIGKLRPTVTMPGRTGARLFDRAHIDELRRKQAA